MQREKTGIHIKISGLEKAAILLTLCFVVCTVGFFLWQNRSRDLTLVETAPTDWSQEQTVPEEPAPGMLRGEVLDLNTAGEEDLIRLPGIGEKRAADIVTYRTRHGGFSQVEELLEISGIGQATLDGLRDYVTVGGGMEP